MKLPQISNTADYQRHFNDDIWRSVAASICARHNLPHSALRRAPQGENIIFLVDSALVIKIYTPLRRGYAREKSALEFAEGKLGINTPALLHTGEIEGWSYLVMTQLAGLPMREVWPGVEARERIEIVSRLGRALKNLHSHAAPLADPALNPGWHKFIERQAETSLERQRAAGANSQWLESLPAYIEARLGLLPETSEPVLLHGDVHPINVLLAQEGGRWQISGLFDFADSLCGFHEYEFVAPGVLMVQGNRDLQRALLLAYGYEESELNLNLRARLMLLTVLYECSDLRKYALRLRPEAVNFTLDELEAAIWTFAA
ncbi:MAG TPA: aminoglycoside phosphotransferase family protein [Pyrinomonadaceae bacterium]|nr:aminoglycoside phosphotransferase family protein [Pyrinomonadaceae bacterium]